MPPDYMIAFFGSAIIAMIASMKFMDRGVRLQQDILARGILTQGTVIGLKQRPLMSAFARIYFQFNPGTAGHPIRTWHVDRRSVEEWSASLPQIGADVAVRYLPENPSQAVIVKLVSRLSK